MSWWPFGRKKEEQPPWLKAYLTEAKKSIPGIRKIQQLSFVVLDTEATGFDSKKDELLSCGIIGIEEEKIKISSSKEWQFASEKSPGKSATIHGLIHPKNPIELKTFCQELLGNLRGSIIVGHHIGFDLDLLCKTFQPFGFNQFPNPKIDTMNLAVRLDFGPQVDWNRVRKEDYSLDALCEKFNIPKEDRHTAGGDAFLTAQLLLKLLKQAEKKGILTYQELFR